VSECKHVWQIGEWKMSKPYLGIFIVLTIIGIFLITKIPAEQQIYVSIMLIICFMIACIKCDIVERGNIKLRKKIGGQAMNITMEPCWKFIVNNPVDQIKYIRGEADEALEAALNGDLEAADLENGDVMQACVTYFKGRGYNQVTVDELTEAVHRKNAERGYYKP
jgi:hypothetical protein